MIREGKLSDADQISKIKVESWKETYKNLMPDNVLEDITFEKEKEKFINKFGKRRIVVYEENDEILGYSFFGKRQNLIQENMADYTSEIYALYIKNDYRRKGVGTKIIQHICNTLKEENNDKVLLWCLKGNQGAIDFYKKNGFEYLKDKAQELNGINVEELSFGKKL